MSRRRTRTINKTKARTRKRLTGGTGKRAASFAAGLIAALAATIAPLKTLAVRVIAWAWHSRGMRRVAGVAAGLVVLAALSWVMLDNLRETARYTLDPARIELAAEPGWATGSLAKRLKADIEGELRAELADLPPTHAFDDDVMAAITDRLQRNAWVRRVQSIERRFPSAPEGFSRLVPSLEIRQPAVIVECDSAYVLIDGESVVLPLTVPRDANALAEFRSQLAQPLHLVRGVKGQAPKAGIVWQSEQVAAALSMERVVRRAELDRAFPIDAIELVAVPERANSRGRVSYPAEGAVMLVPDQGQLPDSLVIWGLPPVHASTLERSPNDKIAELMRRLDKGDVSGKPIDLRRPG